MRAVVLVLRGRFRQYGKSWLVLGLLVAVAGGFVLAAAAAGRRTAAAFPGYVARHGYDLVVYSAQPLPKLATLPDVRSVTPVQVTAGGQPRCASCRRPIDNPNFLINEVPPRVLPRMVTLLSGRMPNQSRPGEVLASQTLAADNGVRVGSVIRVPLYSEAALQGTIAHPRPVLQPALRVVGIAVMEGEFQTGPNPHYDLFATTAFTARAGHRVSALTLSYVRFRHGAAGLAAFHSQLRALPVVGTDDLDSNVAGVQSSIRPQVIGWYGLAGLLALAALAVIAQAVARQAATERADHQTLLALGLRPRGLIGVSLLRSAAVGAAGAVGAAALAVLLSPLTPVGEARLADPHPGAMSFDPVALLAGPLAVLAVVLALSVWPAVRHARLTPGPPPRAAPAAAGRAGAATGLPPTALIGIRHAVERGRGGQPVATALLGTVLAVAALSATAVFGASLAHLISSPGLYGSPFQVYFAPDGTDRAPEVITGPLLTSLRRDGAIERITLAAYEEITVNGRHVPALAVTPVRGPVLLSAVAGRPPRGDREIMLGAAAMRSTGARLGGYVQVTVADPDGKPHTSRFHVIGRASLNAGAGTTQNGAAVTIGALTAAQCPAGAGQLACQRAVRRGIDFEVLVRAAPGLAGAAALARHIRQYPSYAYRPGTPAELVSFGQSVNFPLLFGVALSLFGAATMLHLLLVSVARRRRETALLKVLGFVRRQVAAAVCWQASSVALIGIVAGVPVGIAAGKAAWRLFAANFGVIPVEVIRPLLLLALAAGVLLAANLLAAVPALLAARSRPGQLLRAE
jgi:FtsX-like permease family